MHDHILRDAEIKAFLNMSAGRRQISERTKNRMLQVWLQMREAGGEAVMHPDVSILPGDGVHMAVSCGRTRGLELTVRGDGTVRICGAGETWLLGPEDSVPQPPLSILFPPPKG